MKRFRQAAVSYARKRAKTFATAVGKRVYRNVKKRVGKRMLKIQSKSIKAFRALGGSGRPMNSIRLMDFSTGSNANAVYSVELTNISQGSATTERESNSIMFKGFSYNFMFRSASTEKQYLNFACVTPKTYQSVLQPDAWFRKNDGDNNVSFNDTELTALAKYDRPMNADQFIIHFRKKVVLGAIPNFQGNLGNFDNNSNNCKHFKGYKAINSRVSYSDGGTGVAADYKIYLVWWFNPVNDIAPLTPFQNYMAWDRDIRIVFNGE